MCVCGAGVPLRAQEMLLEFKAEIIGSVIQIFGQDFSSLRVVSQLMFGLGLKEGMIVALLEGQP